MLSVLVASSLFAFSTALVEAKTSPSYYGPTAQCRDRTYSYAANHRGACSHHGGVRVWYR